MPTSVFVSKFQTFLTLFYLSTLSTLFSLKVLEEIIKKKRYVICLPFSFTGLQENFYNQSKKYSLYSHQKPIQCPFGLMEILRFIVLAVFKHNYRWIGNCNQSYMLQRNFFRPNLKKKTIMEIFISDCLVFFSYGSHFFEGNTCSLVFCSVDSYKILVPKTCRGRVTPCFALVFRQS